MPIHSLKICRVAAAVVLIAAAPLSVFAAGYWNIPSNFCQCMGYGNGGGYHAPLILGPITCDEWYRTNECRLPYAPAPGYGCGCGGSSCGASQPAIMEQTGLPSEQMEAAPVPAAYRAPYRR